MQVCGFGHRGNVGRTEDAGRLCFLGAKWTFKKLVIPSSASQVRSSAEIGSLNPECGLAFSVNGALAVCTLSVLWKFLRLLCRVRVIRSDDDVLVVCPTILTEDGMQAQHLGATLALYRLVKGQVSGTGRADVGCVKPCLRVHAVRGEFWPLASFLSTDCCS